MTDDRDEFAVVQFFRDGTHDYLCRWIGAEEAVKVAKFLTETASAASGLITRIIITDGGDNTCFEWLHGQGVTFPPRGGLNEHHEPR